MSGDAGDAGDAVAAAGRGRTSPMAGKPGRRSRRRAAAQALELSRAAALALAPAGARIEVEAGALDPRLRLAACAQVQAYQRPGQPAWGRTRIGLRCLQGAALWNVMLPVTVQVWAPALVASAPLPTGAALQADQLNRRGRWARCRARRSRPAALHGRTRTRRCAGQRRRRRVQQRRWFSDGETCRCRARRRFRSRRRTGAERRLDGQTARVRIDSGDPQRHGRGRTAVEVRFDGDSGALCAARPPCLQGRNEKIARRPKVRPPGNR